MLSGIVFDLDGTLWHTEQVYLYAYRKLCHVYHVSDPLPDSTVENCLGVKIDKVLAFLFPMVENQQELTGFALKFAAEYILMHPEECCFEGVVSMLRELAKTTGVYIVSNCLRPFADAFIAVSGTADIIKEIYTIENGEKYENLERIARGLEGKLLFVGDCEDDYQSIRDHSNILFCYAEYGYKPCTHYDYSIKTAGELLDVIAQINIKERQLQGKKYRVLSHEKNRVTLIQNPDGTQYFGYVDCVDENFDLVIKQLKQLSTGKLIGPINGNTYYPYRFALDEYDWQLFPDCQGQKELPFFLSNGFRVHQEYASLLMGIHQGAWKRAKKVKLPDGYREEVYHGAQVYERLPEIYEVAVDAFSDAYLHEPISRDDFIGIYTAGLKGVTPDLVMIYRDDRPIALCFCYEDVLKRFYVCKTIAIKKENRESGVAMRLLDRSYQMMTELGYSEVLHHFRRKQGKKPFFGAEKTLIREKKYGLLEWENETET